MGKHTSPIHRLRRKAICVLSTTELRGALKRAAAAALFWSPLSRSDRPVAAGQDVSSATALIQQRNAPNRMLSGGGAVEVL